MGKPGNFSFLIRSRAVPHGSRKPVHGLLAHMKPEEATKTMLLAP